MIRVTVLPEQQRNAIRCFRSSGTVVELPFAFEKVETAILAWFDKIVPNHPARLADKMDDQLFTDDEPNTAATV